MIDKACDFIKKYSSRIDAIRAVAFAKNILSSLEELGDRGDVIDQLCLLEKELDVYKDDELSQRVMDYFNEINGTSFRHAGKIKAIINQVPKATFEQFASIIHHRKELWGDDPKMRQYIRPATLFGSVQRFKTYLDDATQYWIEKQKQNGKRSYQ